MSVDKPIVQFQEVIRWNIKCKYRNTSFKGILSLKFGIYILKYPILAVENFNQNIFFFKRCQSMYNNLRVCIVSNS